MEVPTYLPTIKSPTNNSRASAASYETAASLCSEVPRRSRITQSAATKVTAIKVRVTGALTYRICLIRAFHACNNRLKPQHCTITSPNNEGPLGLCGLRLWSYGDNAGKVLRLPGSCVPRLFSVEWATCA